MEVQYHSKKSNLFQWTWGSNTRAWREFCGTCWFLTPTQISNFITQSLKPIRCKLYQAIQYIENPPKLQIWFTSNELLANATCHDVFLRYFVLDAEPRSVDPPGPVAWPSEPYATSQRTEKETIFDYLQDKAQDDVQPPGLLWNQISARFPIPALHGIHPAFFCQVCRPRVPISQEFWGWSWVMIELSVLWTQTPMRWFHERLWTACLKSWTKYIKTLYTSHDITFSSPKKVTSYQPQIAKATVICPGEVHDTGSNAEEELTVDWLGLNRVKVPWEKLGVWPVVLRNQHLFIDRADT